MGGCGPRWCRQRLAPLLLPQRLQDIGRRHGKLTQSYPHGVVDGVGDGRHGRYDGHLADPPDPIRVPRIGYLDDHRVDHGQVQAGGHAIIKEAGVHHLALLVEEVLLVECPADTLDGTTLHLPLDIPRVDRLPRILEGRIA